MQEDNKKITREFGLTSLAVNNKTTVLVLTVLIFFTGIMAYVGMPKESFPEIKLPTIVVSSPYPGNSPENIEKLLTRPLEKEINEINGISKITSNSVQDYSSIIVEFGSGVEVEEALQDVKDAIDRAKSELPTDMDQDPMASEINFGEFPIMFIYISGQYSSVELKEYAEYYKDKFEDLEEISAVTIRGIEEKEVKVNLDVHKLASLKLSFGDVEQAIASRNITMSAGNAKTNGVITSIKIDGEFKTVSEIEDIVIKHEKEELVFLRDVLASPIVLKPKERESYARLEGQNVILLDVVKESGKNLLSASDKINEIIRQSKEENTVVPHDVTITVSIDQSDQTRSSVANLENSIISGVILVVLVLLFFLGTRNAMFVGVAIPMSMLLSFLVLSAMGVTINMMVLFGLIMALGMLVDNGIVVVENVYRLMEDEGLTPLQAAKEGVGEIAWPIISSTATTLAAFIPLALWPGMMGEFMFFLPLTLIVVLSSSLFVALVINPVLAAMFMSKEKKEINYKNVRNWVVVLVAFGVFCIGSSLSVANLFFCGALLMLLNVYVLTPMADAFQERFLPRLEAWYERVLTWATSGRNPVKVFFATFGLLIMSQVLFMKFTPSIVFFPDNEPNYVNVFVEMPLGTDIDVTNEVTMDLEKQVSEIVKPYRSAIKMVSSAVGAGTSDPGDPNASGGNSLTPHKARIQIEFVKYELRGDINTLDVMSAIRKGIDKDKFPDAVVIVDKNSNGPPTGKPINIEISGEDYAVIMQHAEALETIINNSAIRGIEELKTDLETGKPERVIQIDNTKAARLGVSTRDIAMTLRTALYGKEVSKFKDGEDDYDIMVRLAESERYDFNALLNQPITFRDQTNGQIKQIPINAVASLEPMHSLGAVRRKNLDRVVTLYSNVEEGFNANDVNIEIKDLLADYEMPDGYSFKFTGEQEEQAKEMKFLLTALGIAAFLILMIIVGQFNRISTPVVIMVTVLLSTIGVFLGLVIFQMEFVIIMTMIGIISLAGIVVNNAIVLADYSVLLMDRKKAELGTDDRLGKEDLVSSVVKAGKTRLRPVLLTAITTILGLVPLAIGLNIDFFRLFSEYNPDFYIGGENVIFWGPMSWTIIFGMTFATFLTLIVVPIMFLGVERLKFYIYEKGIMYTLKALVSWLTFRLYKFNA